MAEVRWVTSDSDLPTDRQYVLIAYGEDCCSLGQVGLHWRSKEPMGRLHQSLPPVEARLDADSDPWGYVGR